MTDWLGRAGPVIPLSRGWHAASAATAAGTSDAFISASRLESLKVNGILAPSLVQEGLPASAQSRFAQGLGSVASERLPADTIVAQFARRVELSPRGSRFRQQNEELEVGPLMVPGRRWPSAAADGGLSMCCGLTGYASGSLQPHDQDDQSPDRLTHGQWALVPRYRPLECSRCQLYMSR